MKYLVAVIFVAVFWVGLELGKVVGVSEAMYTTAREYEGRD